MNAVPIVTVIIPAYNCAHVLGLAIQSVLDQTLTELEVHVVGDHCTDDSEAVVRAFGDPRVHWTNLPVNSGSQSAPNNEGIRRAHGRYIAYLGQDDLWWPTHLASLVQALESSGADLVHAMGARIGPDGIVGAMGPPPTGSTYATFAGSPCAWLHRREIVLDVGAWPDHRTLSRAIDVAYLQEIWRAGKTIVFNPELTVLKFPAALFSIYTSRGVPLQATYLERIQRAPEELRRTVLTDLALLPYRTKPWTDCPWYQLPRRLVRLAVGHLGRRLPTASDKDGSALSRFRVRRHQALRRQSLILKGAIRPDDRGH